MLESGRVDFRAIERVTFSQEDYQRLIDEAGIDMNAVFAELQEDGVKKFAESFDALFAMLEEKTGAGAS